jgi:hypothetical protein
VVELGRVIDRAEEPGEIIKESVVAATDIRLDRETIGGIDGSDLVERDGSSKTCPREIDELD